MKQLPETIIRLNDGAEFILDEKNRTYSLKSPNNDKEKGHLVWEYSYESLMEGDSKGFFKIADGTEDLKAMRKSFYEKFLTDTSRDGKIWGRKSIL